MEVVFLYRWRAGWPGIGGSHFSRSREILPKAAPASFAAGTLAARPTTASSFMPPGNTPGGARLLQELT